MLIWLLTSKTYTVVQYCGTRVSIVTKCAQQMECRHQCTDSLTVMTDDVRQSQWGCVALGSGLCDDVVVSLRDEDRTLGLSSN